MECRRYVTLQPGRERYIILGEVLLLHGREGIVEPGRLRVARDGYAPIGRLFGGGYVKTRDRFEMPRISYREWLRRADSPRTRILRPLGKLR